MPRKPGEHPIEATTARLAMPKCGAETNDGTPCENLRGFKTTHVGDGRCFLHGGLQPGDKRLTHGRFSTERGGIKHPRIADLYERFMADPDPLNILDDIVLMRAIAVDYIERYHEITDALLAWYADEKALSTPLATPIMRGFDHALDAWESNLKGEGEWSPERERELTATNRVLSRLRGECRAPKPRKVPDISEASALLEAVTRSVERLEKMRTANVISEAELSRIINAMSRVVDVIVQDQETKDKIREGWLVIVTR